MIGRHLQLDQVCLNAHDQAISVVVVESGDRIVSAFIYAGIKYYVITEWNRSAETLMLVSDY